MYSEKINETTNQPWFKSCFKKQDKEPLNKDLTGRILHRCQSEEVIK
ncbi:MAG: hypothetical protein Q8N08_05760 [Methanobacteriaceae archaeon]|nr:hypothetical protein [Methanobacteriaceae archaeon]